MPLEDAAVLVAEVDGRLVGAVAWRSPHRSRFPPVQREELPLALAMSAELQGACPTTAQAMLRRPPELINWRIRSVTDDLAAAPWP